MFIRRGVERGQGIGRSGTVVRAELGCGSRSRRLGERSASDDRTNRIAVSASDLIEQGCGSRLL
jgi:hypothetical protein